MKGHKQRFSGKWILWCLAFCSFGAIVHHKEEGRSLPLGNGCLSSQASDDKSNWKGLCGDLHVISNYTWVSLLTVVIFQRCKFSPICNTTFKQIICALSFETRVQHFFLFYPSYYAKLYCFTAIWFIGVSFVGLG